MERVRRRFCSSFCFDHTGRKRQEEVLKFRVELANFGKVLSYILYCCILISCLESDQQSDIPQAWYTAILDSKFKEVYMKRKKNKEC